MNETLVKLAVAYNSINEQYEALDRKLSELSGEQEPSEQEMTQLTSLENVMEILMERILNH